MTYRDMQRLLAGLEQQAQDDDTPADPFAPRYIDYRKLIGPSAPQTGPIRIQWVDYAGPRTDEQVEMQR